MILNTILDSKSHIKQIFPDLKIHPGLSSFLLICFVWCYWFLRVSGDETIPIRFRIWFYIDWDRYHVLKLCFWMKTSFFIPALRKDELIIPRQKTTDLESWLQIWSHDLRRSWHPPCGSADTRVPDRTFWKCSFCRDMDVSECSIHVCYITKDSLMMESLFVYKKQQNL